MPTTACTSRSRKSCDPDPPFLANQGSGLCYGSGYPYLEVMGSVSPYAPDRGRTIACAGCGGLGVRHARRLRRLRGEKYRVYGASRHVRTDRVWAAEGSGNFITVREPAAVSIGPTGLMGPINPNMCCAARLFASFDYRQVLYVLYVLFVLFACTSQGGLRSRQRHFIIHLSSFIIIFLRPAKKSGFPHFFICKVPARAVYYLYHKDTFP